LTPHPAPLILGPLMFSGIVETTSKTQALLESSHADLLRFTLSRPQNFTDLHIGDSVACNGVCLTVEAFTDKDIQFALGKETLKVTGWTPEGIKTMTWNLERSLKLGDRIHGHIVTGHVDFVGQVTQSDAGPESLSLRISFPFEQSPYFWPKGSVCLNGVSLTLNEVGENFFEVHLIPETLKTTNLGTLKPGDRVNVEIDSFARGWVHYFKEKGTPRGTSLR